MKPRKTRDPQSRVRLVFARFNEAAAVKPRKTRRKGREDHPVAQGSFNEAAAVKPRKTVRMRQAAAISSSFNEAAAVKPRKTLRT